MEVQARDMPVYLMSRCIPVTECGCWIFMGYLNAYGYGQIGSSIVGRTRLVHRVSYEVFKGAIPPGLDVMHSCDTPCCINPDHLSVGDRKTNMQGMVARGRQLSGMKNPAARITDADVLAIRRSPMEGKKLARLMGISQSLVSLIRRRKIWRHI